MPPKQLDKKVAEEQPANELPDTGCHRFVFKNGSFYEGEYTTVDSIRVRHGMGTFVEFLCKHNEENDIPGFDPVPCYVKPFESSLETESSKELKEKKILTEKFGFVRHVRPGPLSQIFMGEWCNDNFVSGTIRYADGSTYTGKLDEQNNYVSGGTYVFPDGSSWTGDYMNSEMNGQGIFVDSEGHSWKARMRNNYGEACEEEHNSMLDKPLEKGATQ